MPHFRSFHPRAIGPCGALLALGLALAPGLGAQQTGAVSGRVTDASTGAPLAAVQVRIPSLAIGVLTTQDGRYTLGSVPAGSHTLVAERIGYGSATHEGVTITAGESTLRNFELAQIALALDEVIVTGTPGGTRRRAIGNAVTRLDAAEVTATRPIRSMQDIIQGRSPGVSFARTSGNVGEGSFIRIRGVSSFGLGTQPLIYIDGVRMDNSTTLGPSIPNLGQTRSSSALDDLNPLDIASVEIIKGPAAATLYGTEASAGVIQIITKRGQTGSPRFDAQVSQGSNFLMDPAGMIGDQYVCSIQRFPCPEDQLRRFNIIEEERAKGLKPVGNGPTQRYNLSVRGGTDAINYFLSTDYSGQEGLRSTNWSNRLSTRANVGVQLAEQLNLAVSLGYTDGETRYGTGLLEGGGLWPHLMWAQGRDLDQGGRGYLAQTPEEFDIPEATRNFTRFTSGVTLSHNPFPWLQQRLIVGLDRGEEESQTLFPRDIEGAAGPFGSASLGQVTLLRPINTEYSVDYSASARYALNDGLAFTSSVGAQYSSSELNRIQTIGRVFPSPAIRSIEGATETSATQFFRQNKALGFFVQQEVGWNDRIFVTGAVRADDSSTFGSNFDAAIYPKLSATWVVSEEPFWNLGLVNSLRLRSAWGQAGRQPGTFAAVTLFSPSVGSGGVPALTPQTLGNPDLGPEVGTELELGVDAALLNDRVSTEFTYFYQKITDALVSVPIAPSHGFPGSQSANLGRLDNWGYELAIKAQAFQTANAGFDLGFSLAYTMNEIKDLGGRTPTTTLRLGMPWPSRNTTHIVSGEFNQARQPTNMMCDAGISMAPSEDLHNTYGWKPGGEVVPCAQTQGRQLLLGPTFSPWTWNVDGTLTLLRRLQVFGMVDAEHGRWMNDYNISCRQITCGFPNTRAALSLSDPIFMESTLFSTRHPTDTRQGFDHDASYVRLREVGARYQIPEGWLGRVGADRATFSLSGRNLWYLWRGQEELGSARIPSPEMSDPTSETGFSLFQWPPLTSIEASLRISF